MTKHISQLLGASEPAFELMISSLERACGQPSIDIRLTTEIMSKVRRKMRELGLDPRDTTGRELYHALFNIVGLHDAFLAQRIGGGDPADVQQMLPLITKSIDTFDIPKSAWVLKASVAKRLLKAMPPKNVMKQLGYRSVDSMLKREPVTELFGALRFAESSSWMAAFIDKYSTVKPSDFEMRDIEVVHMHKKKWERLAEGLVLKNRHNITHVKELGVIIILPIPVDRMPGITITVLPMLLHYINEIRMYASYFKHHQVRQDFGSVFARTISEDPAHHVQMGGQKLHWRVLQRHYGSLSLKYHPEVFEPHVLPEDLAYIKPEEVLYRIEPALHFWHDMDYVGSVDGRGIRVTCSLLDMAVNFINQLTYGYHTTRHMQMALQHELMTRYLAHGALEHQVLQQLDHEVLDRELLILSGRGRK